MGNDTKDPFGFDSLMTNWTQSMNQVMGAMAGAWQENKSEANNSEANNKEEENGADTGTPESDPAESLATAAKYWQTIGSAMLAPETLASVLKGAGAIPSLSMEFGQAMMSSLTEFQTRMAENAVRLGESVDAYQFDRLDEGMPQVWADIYEKEFKKFFHIPQLGLTREYQERVNALMDKYNLFQANYAEFTRLCTLPFQRSVGVMQDKISEMAASGELPEDSQAYYQMWIKVLEGHFMTLFQTPEYVSTLSKTISSLAGFTEARDAVLEDMMRGLPIAQQSDMDDLARQVYALKRKVRRLERELSRSTAPQG
ncbi:MAG: hypothetical protein MI802_19015 [Desulfobacterales bacterium]|nr:hypothetical protein [Desulfobacterales bacterium]